MTSRSAAAAAAVPPGSDLGTVLVVGGNGFLGHHIVRQAVEAWACTRVISVDLRCTRNRHAAGAAVSYHECDITDGAALTALLSRLRPDVVVHTASPVASDARVSHELFRRVNVDGTRAVVDACRAARVRALVYTSSASIVSDFATDLRNADERWPVLRAPAQPEYYSETKAAAEAIVLAANRSRHDGDAGDAGDDDGDSSSLLLTTSIRPAGIFGEGDVQAIAGFIGAYRAGRTGIQLGDNNNIFDWTYVGNVAHAHLLAAHHLLNNNNNNNNNTPSSSPPSRDRAIVDGEAFFITNDSPVYFWDFARAVWRAAGAGSDDKTATTVSCALPRDLALALGSASELFYRALSVLSRIVGVEPRQQPPLFTRQRALLATMTRYYNIDKARTVLGYEPLWSVQEGVDRGVRWYLEHEKEMAVPR